MSEAITQNSPLFLKITFFPPLQMKPFFKNFGRFFVLFLAAFLLFEMPQPIFSERANQAGETPGAEKKHWDPWDKNRPKVSQANQQKLVQACLRDNKIICGGITRKSDPQSNKFTETEIHGKKYTITNYSENDIFLPMKTQHEWERVICAASQGDKIGIDCSDTNEFGGPSMGFPNSNGREAADPFGGKDLNTFEYEKETGPSLGIKIDLIADWVVTQARSCPTSCGNSARNFNGSVTCSTGDDADCDPNTKPPIPTRSCGKTADCPTYTGTWIKGSCPSGCGQSSGWKTVSVSCSGGNCNPSARPSTSRWCQATAACVPVNCQVSSWGRWTDTSGWGSCSANCGGGTQTKKQERKRPITVQPRHGGRACPALTETQSVSRSCNTQPCQCPAKPDHSSWDDAVNGGTQPNCDWSCNAGRIWKDGSCKTTGPYTFGSCPSSHGYGGGTINGTCGFDSCTGSSTKSCAPVCKGGSSWNGNSCACGDNEEWNGSSCVCKDNYEREPVSGKCIATDVTDCQVSTWGSWTDTSSWGSCSKSCGGGVKTKTQERTRSITTQPENGGEPCPALKETRTQKLSCNTQACLSLYECNGYGSWIKRGSCSVSDDCDHFHTIGETCCSPSKPYGPCQNGPIDG